MYIIFQYHYLNWIMCFDEKMFEDTLRRLVMFTWIFQSSVFHILFQFFKVWLSVNKSLAVHAYIKENGEILFFTKIVLFIFFVTLSLNGLFKTKSLFVVFSKDVSTV